MVTHDFFKLAIAERFPDGIFWFNHAVGVEQESVARPDGQVKNGIVGFRDDAKHNAIALDAF